MSVQLPEAAIGDITPKRQHGVLLTASLISSLIMLDSNIVAVSLPAIGRSLGTTFSQMQWIVSAYVLMFASLLLAAGAYADLRGRRFATLVGLAIFATASCLCGLSNSALMLDLARAFQGVGASLLLTASLAVLNHAFEGKARAKAYAFWGACLGIAITLGPLVGGAITELFGWRWAFLINIPICAALFIAARVVMSESRDPEAKRIDVAGIVSFSPVTEDYPRSAPDAPPRGCRPRPRRVCAAKAEVAFRRTPRADRRCVANRHVLRFHK